MGQHKVEVKRIRVGEEDESATTRKAGEKGVGEHLIGDENAGPSAAELIERDAQAEAISEMGAPIARSEAALLPVFPEGVVLNGGPDFFRGDSFLGVKDGEDAAGVNANDDAADVEDDGGGRERVGGRHGPTKARHCSQRLRMRRRTYSCGRGNNR